ncbi:hypothetical protein [Rhodoferax saidenbachensis]|uniref:Uncharacterized protein n=1 Tax=Rhodoferax saidenbachensis TaxID=1484693 RepID=A0ABU1ZQ30_9BURK|nr:hypothetical protein [Rhodoferax saidenbachensis]MDR7307656.1 hypothetical protein [Rhodoferax saidenbachensis]
MPNSKPLRFRTEESLVNDFVLFLNRTRKSKFEVLREYEGGFGIPDLLLYSLPEKRKAKDIASLACINPRLAPLLSEATAKRIDTLAALSQTTGASLNSTRRIFLELSDIGRIKKGSNAMPGFQISPIAIPPFKQVVAIEAKLRDWRRALVQAYRYIQFANESWVLIDHGTSSSALRHKEQFQTYGVGLASFTTGGKLFVHVPAVNRPWSNSALAWRTQALLARDLVQT